MTPELRNTTFTGRPDADAILNSENARDANDALSSLDQRLTDMEDSEGGAAEIVFGTIAGTVCEGNDSRLSDERTPTDTSVTGAKIDATDAPAIRTALGLGSLATESVLPDGTVTFAQTSALITLAKSNASGADANTAQSPFASGQDTVSLDATSTYEFEGYYSIDYGAITTTHRISTGFAGTVGIASIAYSANHRALSDASLGGASTLGQSFQHVTTSSATLICATATEPNRQVWVRGFLVTSTAGTFTPQVTFSSAPGQTVTFLAGSFFKLTKLGVNTFTEQGGWT